MQAPYINYLQNKITQYDSNAISLGIGRQIRFARLADFVLTVEISVLCLNVWHTLPYG